MLFHDVILAAFIFSLCPSGDGLTQNWVKQWPDEVYGTPGENITIHCQIHADVQKTISRCRVQWYTVDRNGTYARVDKHSQFSGRHFENSNESHWSTSLTVNSLEMNDTGTFCCNYICKINGTARQHYGTRTRLFVHFKIENETVTQQYPLLATTITDGVKGKSRVCMLCSFLVSIVLFSKFVVFIFFTFVILLSP